jgi:cytoskeleton protein RodZ
MDIGTTLRTAREHRGLTLAQLTSRTKIPVATLEALERNAFDKVPRGIFLRGFLRAYASHVGLDPAEIVGQYLAEYGEVVPTPDVDASAGAAVEDQIQPTPVDPDLAPSGPGWGYALVVAALLIAVISMNRGGSGDAAPTPLPAREDMAAAEIGAVGTARSNPVQAVATAGRTLPALDGAGGSSTAMLRFDLQAQGECWVEAVVDGRRVVYRLMQPGERETIESAGELVIRVGDPAALSYSVNGAPGKPLGRPGIPVTVRFSNQGA